MLFDICRNFKHHCCAWVILMIFKDFNVTSQSLGNDFWTCEPNSNILIFNQLNRFLLVKLSKDFHHMRNPLRRNFLPRVCDCGSKNILSPSLFEFKTYFNDSSLLVVLYSILNQVEHWEIKLRPVYQNFGFNICLGDLHRYVSILHWYLEWL